MGQYGDITRNVKTRTIGEMQIRVGSASANIANGNPALDATNSLGALASTAFTGTREVFEFMSGTPSTVDGTVVLSEMAQIDAAFLEKKPFTMALAAGINPLADLGATMTVIGSSTTAGTTTGNISPDDDGSVNDTFMVVFTSATEGNIYGTESGLVHSFTGLTGLMEPDNGGNPYFSIPANYFSGTWAAGETHTFRTTAFVAGTTSYSNDYSGEVPLGTGQASDFFRVEGVVNFPLATHKMVFILPMTQIVSAVTLDLPEGGEGSTPVAFKGNKATSLVEGGHAIWDSAPLGKIVFTT